MTETSKRNQTRRQCPFCPKQVCTAGGNWERHLRVHAEGGNQQAASEVDKISRIRQFKRRQKAETTLGRRVPPPAGDNVMRAIAGSQPAMDINSMMTSGLCARSVANIASLNLAGGRVMGDDERGRSWVAWNTDPILFDRLCDEMVDMHKHGIKTWQKLKRHNNARRGVSEAPAAGG